MRNHSKKKWIVYFASGNYWSSGISGAHHLLERLKSDYNILFLNSLGLASVNKITKNTIFTRIRSKLVSYLKYIKSDSGFTVFSPISIPLGITWIDKLNTSVLRFQIKLVFQILNIRMPYVIIANPKAATVLNCFNKASIIYLYSDKYSEYREIGDPKYINQLDSTLKSKADYIVSNLKKTYEELLTSKYKEKAVYLPHSVDFLLFNECLTKNTTMPPDLEPITKPIIGYYGTLTNSNNWDLIKFLANERPHFQFVFIGKPRTDIDKQIFNLQNVHFLGYKPYKALPLYLKYFAVCLMFWKQTDWIYNSNPLKTKEFLAMGKPIVSIRIYELEKNYPDLVYLCDTNNDFLVSIDKAVAEDSTQLKKNRIASVKDDSWKRDASRIVELLETHNA